MKNLYRPVCLWACWIISGEDGKDKVLNVLGDLLSILLLGVDLTPDSVGSPDDHKILSEDVPGSKNIECHLVAVIHHSLT